MSPLPQLALVASQGAVVSEACGAVVGDKENQGVLFEPEALERGDDLTDTLVQLLYHFAVGALAEGGASLLRHHLALDPEGRIPRPLEGRVRGLVWDVEAEGLTLVLFDEFHCVARDQVG